MTIDKSKHDYFDVGPANVIAEVPQGITGDFNLSFQATPLKRLAYEYAKARPSHTVVCRGYILRDPPGLNISSITAYANKEKLGKVQWGYLSRGSSGRGFLINSPSLDAKRVRGSATTTEDEKRALKLCLSSFTATTIAETVNRRFSEGLNSVTASAGRSGDVYMRLYGPVREAQQKHIHADPENTMEVLVEKYGLASDAAKAFLDHLPAHRALQRMYKESNGTGSGCIVYLSGDTYYVRSVKSQDVTDHYTSDTLPPDLRSAVGLLKLVATNTVIPDVGMRASEDVLYVLRQEGTNP